MIVSSPCPWIKIFSVRKTVLHKIADLQKLVAIIARARSRDKFLHSSLLYATIFRGVRLLLFSGLGGLILGPNQRQRSHGMSRDSGGQDY